MGFIKERTRRYRGLILVLTFCAYTSYHLSRKPISVVKAVLHLNCTNNASASCGWAPFDKDNYEELLGSLDYAYLFAYAIGMFVSGHIAERMNLRYFLTLGMLLSGVTTAMFGVGKLLNIHSLTFFIAVQTLGGFVQSSGWPSVVTAVANWFGKGKRGLIMGIWNSHTSVGNILGSLIAGYYVNQNWAYSFIVPGCIIGGMGIVVYLFLVPKPSDVGCSLPDHYGSGVEVGGNRDGSAEREPLLDEDEENSQGLLQAARASHLSPAEQERPISFINACKVPGVMEFAFCLFFAKLVSYTFLFWLPNYISKSTNFDPEKSADLSTMFDVGGILGGITAGLVSDLSGARALTCAIMLVIAAPLLWLYQVFGSHSLVTSIGLLLVCGFFVNGPYALITTAVSADLGTHPSLHGNAKALATVTAIIDGTGSMGAALGPLLTGIISPYGWNKVFYMLMGADVLALLLLSRLIVKDVQMLCPGTRRHYGIPPSISS